MSKSLGKFNLGLPQGLILSTPTSASPMLSTTSNRAMGAINSIRFPKLFNILQVYTYQMFNLMFPKTNFILVVKTTKQGGVFKNL